MQEELNKIRLTEEIVTVEFIKRVFGRHISILDLSNHFLFQKSTSLLLKFLKSIPASKKPTKSLIMQNCMVSASSLIKILKVFLKKPNSLVSLDFSNNRIQFEPGLSQAICELFSKTAKLKSLTLQGNICTSSQAMAELFTQKFSLLHLNLYDTNLSPEALTVISQVLRRNVCILNLNLGFNSEAFENPDITGIFSESVSENQYIEELCLNGNESLSDVENLQQLCEGLKNNRSLSVLKLGGINLEDFGLRILCSHLLNFLPLMALDIQNNNIGDSGLKSMVAEFPVNLTALDISYNVFKDNVSVLALCGLFTETKSLRKLNISHSFELEHIDNSVIDLFCEALSKNDSLSDLLCEGVKISSDPDDFCSKLNEAIAVRKLSLTYKVSAVNCFSSRNSSFSHEKSMKYISNVPSSLSKSKDGDSGINTGRKEFIETPDQDPIINTSRHIGLSGSFD